MKYASPVEIVFKHPNSYNAEVKKGNCYGWELSGMAYKFWLDREHTKCLSVPVSEVKYVSDDVSFVLLEDPGICANIFGTLRNKVERNLNAVFKDGTSSRVMQVLDDSISELMEDYILNM